MADGSMARRRRQQVAAAAFAARRGQLDLTQEEVARRGDVVVRTVINFESQGVWPNARSRARLEKAVEWPLGQIARLGAEPEPVFDRKLLAEIRKLTPAEREWLVAWLRREAGAAAGSSAAEG